MKITKKKLSYHILLIMPLKLSLNVKLALLSIQFKDISVENNCLFKKKR